MDRTTLTANLKPLERRGLLTVTVDEKDRRGRRLALTPEGHRVLARAVPVWQATHDATEALLEGVTAAQLRQGLRALG